MKKLNLRVYDLQDKIWVEDFLVDSEGKVYVFEMGEEVARYDTPVAILQDSNLVDINGIAIFEGDIVKVETSFGTVNAKVYFEEGEFKITAGDWGDSLLSDFDVEVLGNEFDNTNLLKNSLNSEL